MTHPTLANPDKVKPTNSWRADICKYDEDAGSRLEQLLGQHFLAGDRLSPKLMHLIWTGIDLVVNHLYPEGADIHIRAALENGATAEEIVEVFQIASSAADRTMARALPVVLDEIANAAIAPPTTERPLGDDQRQLLDLLEARIGVIPDWIPAAMRVAPEFMKAYLGFSHRVHGTPALDPISRQLIYLAIFSSPALIEETQVRHYTRHALEAGASAQDVVDVILLVTGISLHSAMTGLPLLSSAVTA